MQGYYNRGLYQQATQYIDSLKDNRYVNGSTFYFFSRIYSLNNEFDKTLFHLEKAVKRGITKEQIERMYDLDKFKDSHLYIVFELNYDKWHQEYLVNESNFELDSIYINEIRNIRAKVLEIRYKSVITEDGDEIYELRDSPEIYLKAKKQDSINFYDLSELIILKGFPTAKVVGTKTLRYVSEILDNYVEYYNSLPLWQQVKKIILDEITAGHLKPYFLAMLEDLYLFKTNQPIKYATQINYFKQVQNEIVKYKNLEVENPEELNIRRKSIGLCPIEIEYWSLAKELPKSLQNVKFK